MKIRTQPMARDRREQCSGDRCPVQQPERPPQTEGRRCEEGFGMLPSCAPLANPYVPMQPNNPATYPAKKGVVRGTLFPGLDLPFMGMVNSGELSDTHLHELQALGFAIAELGQYLDTHPEDGEAFALFQSYAALYQKGREEYEAMHGPLTQRASAAGEQYAWLRDPWPWELAANHGMEG